MVTKQPTTTPRRVRTGCIPCRRRKKKCDERKPTCLGCERNVIACAWADPCKKEMARRKPLYMRRVTGSLGVGKTSHSASPAWKVASLPRLQQTDMPGLSPLLRRVLGLDSSMTLFSHFIACTVPKMATRQGAANPWSTLVLAQMQLDEMFLHAVLALSSAHMGTKNPNIILDGEVHHGIALSCLKDRVSKYSTGGQPLFPLVITALSLALYEGMRVSNSGAAFQHILGAGKLLRLWLEAPSSEPGHRLDGFMIETYFYLTTLSSVSVGCERGTDVFLETSALLQDARFTTSAEFGHICGDLHFFYVTIPRISGLSHRKACDISYFGRVQPATSAEYQEIHKSLMEWSHPALSPASFPQMAEVYRHTLLIYLMASFSGNDSWRWDDGCISYHLSEALRVLKCLALEDPSCPIVAWPLAILGCYANDTRDRSWIKERLLLQYEFDGMRNFKGVADLLTTLWHSGPIERERFDPWACFKRLASSMLIG